MNSHITHLSCPDCGLEHHDIQAEHHVCSCGMPLLVHYDLHRIGRSLNPGQWTGRPASMWRYRELLPIDPEEAVSLGEGMTPLLPLIRWQANHRPDRLLIKDEGTNPTGTFKARGAAAGISVARALGITDIVMPTAGNAGGAWSLYAARAGIRAHIAMPRTAPAAAIDECRLAGADLRLVDGLISDAGQLTARLASEHGWYDAATLREPYRIEGKKTMGLELYEQLNCQVPDVVVYPCGGGVGLIGIHKALSELRELGWIDRLPRMMAVQAETCAPIVRAFEQGDERSEFWTDARTVAAGICVPRALGDFLVLRAIRSTGGAAVTVSDGQITSAVESLASAEGMYVCPEGAAALVGTCLLYKRGLIGPDDLTVVINTGSGLKYGGVNRDTD